MRFRRRTSRKINIITPDGEDADALLIYAVKAERYLPKNSITILENGGDTYPAMLEAIRTAQESIEIETYILREDYVGTRFVEALSERASAGVKVRLIFDGFGSMGLDTSFLEKMTKGNIEYREYHPILPWRRRFSLQNRDHRKILVVDNRIGFCGGLNIGKEYDSKENGGGGWHDIHARLEGPVVLELAKLFQQTWIRCDGQEYELPLRYSRGDGDCGEVLARVVSNRLLHKRFQFRRAYVRAINNAEKSISIMNAYFIPGLMMRRALAKAAKRGVKVRVIVPLHSDVSLVRKASQYLYSRMLKNNIQIYEWNGPMMHAKTCVIDSTWGLIGSYNMDNQSLRKNLEVAVTFVNRNVAREMQQMFERDAKECRIVKFDEWKKRSRWRKFVEWFAYQFRTFL